MKRFFTFFIILIALLIALQSFSQNFHFEPTDELTKTINISGISDLNINIIRNNTVDTLYLEYELITNTLPEEWYQGYCDNHGCWGSLPESGVMSPCFEDINSYIRLSIDPNNIEGSGVVKYFVYETGYYEDGLLMTFNIDTPGYVGLEDVSGSSISFYPNPATEFIHIKSTVEIAKVSIYSLTGQLVKDYISPAANSGLDISDLKGGIYLFKSTNTNGQIFTQKIKKL